MTIPFVYLIGWTKLDKWYIGCRYAEGCSPKNLWQNYFTSSDYVEEFRKEHGEPDSFEILKESNTSKEALDFEKEKQREFDVINNDRFLNRSICGHYINGMEGKHHSEKTKEKISKARKGWIPTQEYRQKMSILKKGVKHTSESKLKMSEIQKELNRLNPRSKEHSEKIANALRGKRASEETKRKMSESHKGKKASEETKEKISKNNGSKLEYIRKRKSENYKGEGNPFYGKKHSEETRRKISESHKRRKILMHD